MTIQDPHFFGRSLSVAQALDRRCNNFDLFRLIGLTPHLDWLLLTKRPQNIAKMLPPDYVLAGKPASNVWLGCTTENQEEADRRIPHLLAVPAKVHFLSCEPLLGPVNLRTIYREYSQGVLIDNALDGFRSNGQGGTYGNKIDWIITGGESGPKARPSNPQWFRSIRGQCAAAGVAYFHKQNGEFASVNDVEGPGVHHSFPDGMTVVRRVGKTKAGALLDGREHKEFPA